MRKSDKGTYNPDWELEEQSEAFQWQKEYMSEGRLESELDIDTEQQYNEELGLQFPRKT